MGMQIRSDQRRDFSPRTVMRHIRRATRELSSGRRDRARMHLRDALEMMPPSADAASEAFRRLMLEASRVAVRLDGSTKLASLLRDHLQHKRDDEEVWVALVEVLKASNKVEEALEACDEGIRECLDPSEILMVKAQMLMEDRREEALEILWRLASGGRVHERALEILEREEGASARLHLLRATHHRREGDVGRALQALDAATGEDPRCVEALEGKARIFMDMGRWQEALDCLKAAIQIESTRSILWELKARTEEQRGDVDEAIRSLQVSLRYEPENVEALKRLGNLLVSRGRYEEASEVLGRAAALAPGDSQVLDGWRAALRALGRWEDFRQVCDRLLKMQPERADVILDVAASWLAVDGRQKAEELLRKLLENRTCSLETLRQAANMAVKAGMWETTLEVSNRILRRWPADQVGLRSRALALLGSDRKEQALKALNRATRSHTDIELLRAKLDLLKSMQRPKAAYACCEEMLRIDPKRPEVYLEMADAAASMGRRKAALQACERGLRNLPGNVDILLKKAVLLYDEGRYGDACRVYEEAIELQPESFPAWKGYGLCLRALRSPDEAAEAFDRTLRIRDDPECWYHRGLCLQEAGRLDQAVKCLERAVEIDDSPRAWMALGNCLLQAGRFQDALHSFDKVLEVQPESVEACLRRAECLMGLGEHQEAIRTLDEGLRRQGSSADLLYSRVQCLMELKRPQEAYDSAIALTDLVRDDPQVWMLRAEVSASLGLTTEALDCLKEAARLVPRDPTPRLEEAKLLLAAGDYRGALEVCSEAAALDKTSGTAARLRGQALAGLERHEEAVMAFDEALAADPGDGEALRGKALSLARLGRHEEALRSVETLVSHAPTDPWRHYWKAVILSEGGLWEESLKSLNQALYYGGSDPTILAMKGRVLSELGRAEEGRRMVEDALSTHPDDVELLRAHVSILLGQKRYQEALSQAETILAKRSRDRDLWLMRAEALAALGRRDEAVECLEMAVRSAPPSKSVWKQCSSIYLSLGQEEAALACYDQAIALDPRDADLWVSRGRLCERLGRWREAVESHSSALEIRPRDEAVLCALGRGYTELGLYEEAREAYQEALSVSPTLDEALRGIKEVEERRREDRVKAYAWKVLEFEAVNERPATKEEVFKYCNVPVDLLDEVIGYVNEPPPLDILSLPEQELRRLETLSREVLANMSGVGLPRLSQIVQECPYVDPHEAREVLGYVRGVLDLEAPVEDIPGMERLMKMALDLPREEWNALSLARSLRIGVYEAKRLEAALRIFQERVEGEERHRPTEEPRGGRTCRKHGASGIYEHFCGQYLCSACIVGGRCPVCRHPVSRALSGFRTQQELGEGSLR
jgi:tetratricopeptide (TPR) repeat protein